MPIMLYGLRQNLETSGMFYLLDGEVYEYGGV